MSEDVGLVELHGDPLGRSVAAPLGTAGSDLVVEDVECALASEVVLRRGGGGEPIEAAAVAIIAVVFRVGEISAEKGARSGSENGEGLKRSGEQ